MTARSFPAFEPRRGTVRGRTWWGRAWTKAMEDTSRDQGRLSRGRTYARAGRVGAITVSPGRLTAMVQGTADEPYQTEVFVEQLSDAEWERFLDEVASRAGHIAALLDRDMPHDLVQAAADAGVRLLPTVGDLEPECSCLDWGYPCKHAAALSYQAAWLLDADPFVLLLMRGRGEAELLDELQRRNARAASVSGGPPREPAVAGTPVVGTPADEAYRAEVAPLPDLPRAPGPLPSPAEFPEASGVDPDALRFLVTNAAAYARGLLSGGDGELTAWQDTVRIAAADADAFSRLARRHPDLPRAVAAWRNGGSAGLLTLETDWTPPKPEQARARAALDAAWEGEQPPEFRVRRNHWTAVGWGAQIRYGQDGRWYPYRKRGSRWWPAGPPDRDPAAALAELLAE